MKLAKRKTGVIYYDCTNFYFEIEQAEDDKQFGLSKENCSLPIVEMELFMDSEGEAKKHLKAWTLEATGWKLSGDDKDLTYDISK